MNAEILIANVLGLVLKILELAKSKELTPEAIDAARLVISNELARMEKGLTSVESAEAANLKKDGNR